MEDNKPIGFTEEQGRKIGQLAEALDTVNADDGIMAAIGDTERIGLWAAQEIAEAMKATCDAS